ncbi:DUF3953 domain-containing protein [Bacillus sp. Marseille-Q1617]|uniref:DUF3953 domain-containing protein n=1 Tax=Bacillus sp. Marseille-Q1617 TaxID=2736887 RepID=UPI00158DB450|nr:DUF3953 domain-containing protein [Bacillus sp. Marseille-Q1617]
MLKVLRITFASIALIMASYSLVTDNFWLQPYTLFLLGVMLLIMGLEEFQKGKIVYGYLSMGVSLFLMVVLFFF